MNSIHSIRFTLSDRTRFAIQASLAIAIAYVLPIAEGWSTQSFTAAIAVMTIASTTRLDLAFAKGVMRILGTLIGGAIGMILVANFAQERLIYLSLLSVLVFLLLYLVRAYKGDSTLFLLILVTILSLYDGGPNDDVVTYALDKTAMTLFGVVVYTAVSIFVFPFPKPNEKRNKTDLKRLFEFDFLTPEHIKGAFIGFLIYTSSVIFWILFNPPIGFTVVTLATVLSATVILSPVTPKMLLIAFSFSLFVALVSYVAILPHLHYGWQLFLFLFLYAFLGYSLLPEGVSMIYMIGTTTFYIQNTMFYDFGVFLNVLFALYLFMFILLFFFYIPFSSKSEDLFLTMYRRYFDLVRIVGKKDRTFAGKLLYEYAKRQLEPTLRSLEFWAGKVDTQYFQIDSGNLSSWIQSARETAHSVLRGKNVSERIEELFQEAKKLGFERIVGGTF